MEKKTISNEIRFAVETLKNADKAMTIAEINAASTDGLVVKPGHITSAVKKGFIAVDGEVIVEKPTTKKVATYVFVASPAADAKLEGTGKTVIDYMTDKTDALTNANISEALGMKVAPGTLTALVKKGYLAKGEDVEIPAIAKSKAKTYVFVSDVTED